MGRKRTIVDLSQEEDALANIGVEMRDRNLAKKTKKNYSRHIKAICKWVVENNKNDGGLVGVVDDGELILPLTVRNRRVLHEFFAHLFANARARDQLESPADITNAYPEPLSYSTVEGYRSALVNKHKVTGLRIDIEFDDKLKEVTGVDIV